MPKAPAPPRRQGGLPLPTSARQALLVVDEHPVSLTHLDKAYFPDRGDCRVDSAEARPRPRNGAPTRSPSVAGGKHAPAAPLGRSLRGRGGADRREASGAKPPAKTGRACGATKRDLLDYSRDVAAFLLPYLRDRPYTMKRFPNGIATPPFFQKEAGSVPAWVRTVAMPSKGERSKVNYVLCNDTATLLYLVNLGCIDHNVWMSRYQTPLEPDFVLLDLDPGPKAGFSTVVRVARILRQLLEESGIAGYPKTSGASGIHIWIPVARGPSFEQTQQFAALLLRSAARRAPELMTEVWRVAARPPASVYLDFRQNAHGKTIPPPYSPRPRPGAPVSCPLQWSELRASLDPARFTIRTMRRRLDRYGDLFAPTLPGARHDTLAAMLRRLQRLQPRAA